MTPFQQKQLGEAMRKLAHSEGHVKKLPEGKLRWSAEERAAMDVPIAADILKCIQVAPKPLAARVLANYLDITYSTVYRCLERLEENGDVQRVALSNGFQWKVADPLQI